ncbi:MAG: U32 family peptidase [Eubacteriaceae bacterium]|nr:U32 family peptidase [Eubacteriaceae bacterium]
MKKPELLAPAGNFEKMKYAVHYGADAVYCAGKKFGLRARADNFSPEELEEAAQWIHRQKKQIYVTLNMIPHEDDFDGLENYVSFLKRIGVDAVLVADPGVFSVVKKVAPDLKISISTQANNTNSHTVAFWHDLGASRIVLARELSGQEIAMIAKRKPVGMEIETFVHGAMCISHSGRCLLSHYFTGRDSNRGDCAQPCRWQYHLVEATRPGAYFPVDEDERGTFIMNSKDLCLERQIPALTAMGVDSFKIEGRMKSPFYVATVTAIYRKIIDEAVKNTQFVVPETWIDELKKVSHRNYTTAFYDGQTTSADQNYGSSSYTRLYDFAGVVNAYDADTGWATIEQRNKIKIGDTLEVFDPDDNHFYFCQNVQKLKDKEGEMITSTPHPKMIYSLKMERPVHPMALIRKKNNDNLKA